MFGFESCDNNNIIITQHSFSPYHKTHIYTDTHNTLVGLWQQPLSECGEQHFMQEISWREEGEAIGEYTCI